MVTPSVEYSKYVEYSNIKECRKEKPLPTFIENKLMKQTLYGYSGNSLYRYISTAFGKEETERLAETPQMVLQRLIKQHPPLQHLIDSLGLVLVEES